jgi:hypothetical protein
VNKNNTRFIVDGFIEIKKYISGLSWKERFMRVFYQRVLYALVSVTMETYFHRNNKGSIKSKVRDFQDMLNEHEVFQEALQKGNFSSMDLYRKVVLCTIRWKCYFLLLILWNAKYFIIKR